MSGHINRRDALAAIAAVGATGVALQGHGAAVKYARFSPDGARIVTVSQDGTARVWRDPPHGGWSSVALEGHGGDFWTAQFSSDGTRIVAGSDKYTAWVWREQPDGNWSSVALKEPGEQLGLSLFDSIFSAQFSPDATRIVTVTQLNQTARVWRELPQGG